MKRLFDKKSKKEPEPEIGTNTIDRIVKDKEGVKKRLEEEEKEFLQKKRDYERKMIEFEKQEVTRRQQEVEEKKEALLDHQRKNLMIQDKVQEQIKVLNMKLEEYRINHRSSEAELETEISQLNDTIAEVQNSLSERIEAYGEDVLSPSAPRMSQDSFDTASLRGANMSPRTLSPRVSRGDLDCPDGEESDSLYPTLPSSMPRCNYYEDTGSAVNCSDSRAWCYFKYTHKDRNTFNKKNVWKGCAVPLDNADYRWTEDKKMMCEDYYYNQKNRYVVGGVCYCQDDLCNSKAARVNSYITCILTFISAQIVIFR